MLILIAAELVIALLHDDLDDPGNSRSGQAEATRGGHSWNEARGSVFDPQVRRPDEADVHDSGDHADGDGLLLLGLAADTTAPTQDETVDTVCATVR